MDFALRTLVNFLFYTNVPFYLLALAGIWAVLWWSIENLRSIVQITKSVLSPYFQPQENKSLVERFGKWAGMKVVTKRWRLEMLK
jgi:ribosomal protein S2